MPPLLRARISKTQADRSTEVVHKIFVETELKVLRSILISDVYQI